MVGSKNRNHYRNYRCSLVEIAFAIDSHDGRLSLTPIITGTAMEELPKTPTPPTCVAASAATSDDDAVLIDQALCAVRHA
jgi:hypothetical protein